MKTITYNYNQYRPIYKFKTDIRKAKRRLTKEIMNNVRPLMWESGYVYHNEDGSTRPLKLFIFDLKSDKYYKIKNSITGDLEFSGFTESGSIITNAYMGIMTMGMEDMPVEDLIKLHYWVMADRYKVLKNSKQLSS